MKTKNHETKVSKKLEPTNALGWRRILRFEVTYVLLLVGSVVVLVLDWLEKVHVENLE